MPTIVFYNSGEHAVPVATNEAKPGYFGVLEGSVSRQTEEYFWHSMVSTFQVRAYLDA